jgi:predicted signal transduction protein with EAL and GGDEF domain
MVARFGGDEFAIIQMGVEQPAAATVLADRLVESLREPFNIKGHRVEIGTSIGVALTDETAYTTESLLRDADIALYRAKATGRDTWRFFRPEMNTEIQQLRHLEADLRRALAEEQFEIYYQPLVEARTQSLLGFEALLRWHHPERGMVPPTEFIPVAEKIGLIKAIGAWVLRKACADAVKWPENIKISVNLSSVQFVNGVLVREVEQALIATGLPANRLELEITESVLLQENPATLGILHQLRDLGVHVSMDDFGTGYSSLSYLRRFPFDKIKIDQSFVGSGARKE